MNPSTSDEIFISVYDLKRLFFKNKHKIIKAAILCGIGAFVFFALKEPSHQVVATFRNSAGKNDQVMGFKNILKTVGIQEQDSIAMALMQSKKLMRTVVEELGMQASVSTRPFFVKGFVRIYESILSECGFTLSDIEPFAFKQVRYEGEKPVRFLIHFTTPDTYEILDQKKVVLAKASLHEQVQIKDVQFSLAKTPSSLSLKKNYTLKIDPWHKVVQKALKKFEVRPSKIDRNVLRLTFSHRDRHLAAGVLNQMMAAYQQYLKEENEEITAVQVAYLEKRQQELSQKFDRVLEEQVVYMKRSLEENGFIGLSQEIELLAVPKEEYTSKLMEMDLELKRLEKVKKKKKDLTAISEKVKAVSEKEDASEQEEKVKMSSTEKKMAEKQKELRQENAIYQPYLNEKEDCQTRLLSLEDKQNKIASTSFKPSEKETLASSDLEAMSLESAQELYKEYNKELDSIQATVKQLLFFRDQMKNPEFELSSLSNLLNDSVSFEMIQKASHLSMQLRDENNRSIKEQERLKEQLETQKQFISHHIGQTIELQKLRAKLIGEKIAGLQELSLKLIKNEKRFIEEKLEELHHRMADLPDKWRMENQLKMKKELSMSMIEGMTQLAESKIVNHHLFQVESKPLDQAYPTENPLPPKLLLFSFTAAFLGGFSIYALSLFQGISKGLPLSPPMLNAYGQHFCGTLSSTCDSSLKELKSKDLETLRKIGALLSSQKKSQGLSAALMGGKDLDYSHALASLLGMQGAKVLLVESHFSGIVPTSHVPGLYQYLTSEESEAAIRQKNAYDFLPSGGTTSHTVEILNLPKFSDFLSHMKQRYDYVLLYTPIPLQNMEAHLLLKYADTVVGAVVEERWEDIQPYRQWSAQKGQEAFSCVLLDVTS